MDIKPFFSAFIFALPGIVALLAALFNWDWFYETRTASFFVNQMGRGSARLFYGLLGAMLLVAGVLITLDAAAV